MKTITIPRGEEKSLILDYQEESRIVLESGSKLSVLELTGSDISYYCHADSILNSTRLCLDKELSIKRSIVLDNNAESNDSQIIIGRTNSPNLTTKIIHADHDSRSNISIKNLAKGSSRIKSEGAVLIDKGSGGSETNLECHSLSSDNASVRASPTLEVIPSNVKAGHAVTCSRINEQHIFYLLSRGISEIDARIMIEKSFIESGLEHSNFKEKCMKEVEKWIFQ